MTINWVGGMLSILVLGLLLLAGFMMQNSVRSLIIGKRAQGVVVGMDSSSHFSDSFKDTPLKSPIVEFSISSGERIRVSGRSYSGSKSLFMWKTLSVLYTAAQIPGMPSYSCGMISPLSLLALSWVLQYLFYYCGFRVSLFQGTPKWTIPSISCLPLFLIFA